MLLLLLLLLLRVSLVEFSCRVGAGVRDVLRGELRVRGGVVAGIAIERLELLLLLLLLLLLPVLGNQVLLVVLMEGAQFLPGEG